MKEEVKKTECLEAKMERSIQEIEQKYKDMGNLTGRSEN